MQGDVSLYCILTNKDIVKFYQEEIRACLLEDKNSAELLLDQYVKLRTFDRSNYFFQVCLSHEDKEHILIKYINSDYANPNYIKLILESMSSSELRISPLVKLKAKNRYDEEMDRLFKNSSGFTYGAQVTFADNQDEEVKCEVKNHDIHILYSTKWIKENRDYATLLNNFIYLFGFTDLQFRMLHVHKMASMSIFEKILGVRGKNEYLMGVAFNQIQCLATVQTIAYYEELKRNGIRMEVILEWFFSDYLKEEFGVEEFDLNLPSEQSTYLEKCRTIASEIDSILKQYKLFIENKEVNEDLFRLSSEHIFIKDIPSQIENKYIYPIGREYAKASNLLFSDQSNLNYVKGKKNNYKCFNKLIQNEEVKKSDFREYQLNEINWLIDNGYLYEDNKGILETNKNRVWFLKEFYYNDVISNYYVKGFREDIKEFEVKDMIEFKSSLLSKPEQDYYNYIMNKSEFSNGLDLRNSYIHGTQSRDTKQHKHDYFTFLRVLILIVIKINEEFCIAKNEHKVVSIKNTSS